ncbi:MAG: WhiB family transcriptional regulator [Acidimicrobiia bacterium]|nr:WhiB family transcriptional regulator [Acidimicrobiia bacterium]
MRLVTSGPDRGIFPLESELAWQRGAACRGLGEESQAIFFPAKGESTAEARAICERCPVADQCLDFALANHCIGVWGGTSERQRRRMRRRPASGASDSRLVGTSLV